MPATARPLLAAAEQPPAYAGRRPARAAKAWAELATRRNPALDADRLELEESAQALIESRYLRELAEIAERRMVFRLADSGVGQRGIAELVGLSQPEVSRRLRRRGLASTEDQVRELILRRHLHQIDRSGFFNALARVDFRPAPPRGAAAFDGGAGDAAVLQQLAEAYLEGILSRADYEQIRQNIARDTHPAP
ncbi:hypothetical protein [Mycetocola spongiae]|uniref:hypothetical protein n=1 Tax=Mycetocola spongiae TaxID=2859226 RepID=UPI001CF34A5B|nr:hypothetical protein [Mycetocola spongiae]UCR88317.1 hypothetical protein KXZ72_10070 [Mycetocola spongiae]